MFDPEPKSVKAALVRFRLDPATGACGRTESNGEPLRSEQLNTLLRTDGEMLSLIDPKTGRPYVGAAEVEISAERAEARADELAAEIKEIQSLRPQLAERERPISRGCDR